jgi:hypothetical protein
MAQSVFSAEVTMSFSLADEQRPGFTIRQRRCPRLSPHTAAPTEGQEPMAVVPFRIDAPGSQARTILHHILEHGDVAGRDAAGRTVITLAVHDWLLERLRTFDAGAEDHDDSGDSEPEVDAEVDGHPH